MEDTNKYDLDSLRKTFEKHAKEFDEYLDKEKERYKEEFGQEYPMDQFSLAKAMHILVKEIQQIKERTTQINIKKETNV